MKKNYFKEKAIQLRKLGKTYPEIEFSLGISRSTLSGWFKHLKLPDRALRRIKMRKEKHLIAARKNSCISRKYKDIEDRKRIYYEIKKKINKLKFSKFSQEILLASLYLGEGFKRRSTIALGNSNPEILQLFVNLLRNIYPINKERFHCALYLRGDQDEKKEKMFWSKKLKIGASQFQKAQFDNRTIGKKTWKWYHGVCAVYYNDTKFEKRLTTLQDLLIKKFT